MDRSAYDGFYELEGRHFWRIAKRRLVLQWLARYRPDRAGLRILDVGGACSLITKELGRFGAVECLEADPATVAFAREKLGVNIRPGRFPDAPLEGRFDVVTMFDVLEHIADDLAALRAARGLMKDNGLLLVTVPALPWLWSDHDVALHHHRRYLKRELTTVLERAGFEVERCSYYTSLLLPFLALQRLAGRLKKRRAAPTYDVRVPFAPVNLAFGVVMWKERLLLRFTDLPVGSALIAACRA